MGSTTDEAPPNRRRRTGPGPAVGGDKESKERSKDGDGGGDKEVWDTLSDSYRRVQSVLDQNRALIQQVNDNHQSRMPDNLAKNVALIQEINGNISKVMSMYSHMSVNFCGTVHQRRANGDSKSSSDNDDKGEE